MNARLKVGSIIRRKNKNGTPIGPYLRVEVIEEDRVFVSVPGLDEPNGILLRKNIYIPSIRSYCISKEKLQKIKIGADTVVSHPLIPAWEKSVWQPSELVRFTCRPEGYETICVVSHTKLGNFTSTQWYKPRSVTSSVKRERSVYIYIDHVIL